MDSKAKEVMTVSGPISPSTLGKTLTHEHLSMTFLCTYIKEAKHISKSIDFSKLAFSVKDIHWIKQYPYSMKSNLFLNECQDEVMEEIKMFKSVGGGTIVDNTTQGITPDLKFLYEVSKNSGVNIVSGAGYYVACAQSQSTMNLTEESIANNIRNQITVGENVETSDGLKTIKSGCIGEIGCTWPLDDFEKKSLRASALVQSELGCPVIIHPGRCDKAPFEIMRIFQEAGGIASKTVMSHLDRTIHDYGILAEFAAIGCYNEYDLFGIENALYQPNIATAMPNDGERIKRIKFLIDEGYGDKITISHDIHTKHRLRKYGGHGFSHILTDVVYLMSNLGLTEKDIDKLLIHNPKEWLSYCCS